MANAAPNKKFPSRCIECGKKRVQPTTIRHELDKNHDGRTYHLVIDRLPANRCEACGEIYFTNASDNAISAALRSDLGLLTPEQIRSNLETLRLPQRQAAEYLGVAAETLSRWINGSMIQSRAMDNLLRIYFGSPEAREKLLGEKRDPSFGATVVKVEKLGEPDDLLMILNAARYSTQTQQKMSDTSPRIHDLEELSRTWETILTRPRITHSLLLWSKAIMASLTGNRSGTAKQGRLFEDKDVEMRVDRYEATFECLARDFWEIPDELRANALESMQYTVRSQRQVISQLRPELTDAINPKT